MIKIVEVLDKVKSDKVLKNKIIRATLFFLFALILVISLVMSSSEEEETIANKEKDNNSLNLIPGDTTSVKDKESVWKKMKWDEMRDNEELAITNDNTFGLEETDRGEDEKISSERTDGSYSSNSSIDAYIESRRKERERQQSIASSSSPGTSRNYNPYGNQSDWEDRPMLNVSPSNNYQNNANNSYNVNNEISYSEKQPSKKLTKTRRKAQSFEELDPIEQKRILLETGRAEYEESAEISAMIMSDGMVKSGQTIIIMTKEDAYINFEKIPKGTTIAGVVSFGENRLLVNFSTIRLKKKIMKVNLSLYALDGLIGLPVGNDLLSKDVSDTGFDEATDEDLTGTRVEKIGKRIFKSARNRKEVKVDLGRDIMCILVNNNVQ
jgi:hypothetical protein